MDKEILFFKEGKNIFPCFASSVHKYLPPARLFCDTSPSELHWSHFPSSTSLFKCPLKYSLKRQKCLFLSHFLPFCFYHYFSSLRYFKGLYPFIYVNILCLNLSPLLFSLWLWLGQAPQKEETAKILFLLWIYCFSPPDLNK